MAKSQTLAEKLKLKIGATKIVFVGVPEVSAFMSKEKNEPYYKVQLKDAITVRCSTNPQLGTFEVDELYVRESAFASDQWKYADEKNPEKGFWMENWVADFSINQKIPIYQETSILEYVRLSRGLKTEERNNEAKKSILDLVAAVKARQEAKK